MRLKISMPTQSYALANGLEVLLAPDHKVPFVHVLVRYRVGAKDDPPGKAGLAHLYEHLMFSAAKHITPDDYLGTLDRSGANDFNGVTQRDATTYYETVPKASLEIALFLEGERMGWARSAITPDQLERERRIVREEYRQNSFDRPYGLLYDLTKQALYPQDHPYFPGRREMDDDAAAITAADVATIGETYYVPNDATLVLVGDFDESNIRALVEKYFAAIPPGTKAPPARTVTRPQAPRLRKVNAVANVDEERVMLGWLMPATTEDGYREHVIAANMLAGYTGGRIRRKDDILSKSTATLHIEPGALGSEAFISMNGGPGSLDDLVDAYEYIQRWMRDAPEIRGWGDEKSSVLVDELYGMESLDTRATQLLDFKQRVGTPEGVMLDMRAFQDLQLARVQRAMDETFALSRAATVYLRKDGGAPMCGKVVP